MQFRTFRFVLLASLLTVPAAVLTQEVPPEDTEAWGPVPRVVTPGPAISAPPPGDAIMLFDGSSLSEWVSANDKSPAAWTLKDGLMTVNKAVGNIETKRSFTDYQLHIEWRVQPGTNETGQARGNSGLFLASTGPGDAGYELQILDSYQSETYVNGQAGSIYKQYPPLVNAMRPQGEWQSYDVIWTAPTFKGDGSLKSPAYVTAFHNGILIQDHVALQGDTTYRGKPAYKAHGPAPIKLQAHGDPSAPISFRNIWVREVKPLVLAAERRPDWMDGDRWPAAVYDKVAPTLPTELRRPAILVFGKTNGYREDAQIKASMAAIEKLVRARGWGVYGTENAAVFNKEQLQRFDAVVFSSTSGDLFTAAQRAAFKDWLEAGGGFVGVHGAGGDHDYAWTWFRENVIGAKFIGHVMNPQFREGNIRVEDRTHPATRHLPRNWKWTEEYYSFASSPRGAGAQILATVDENSYKPEGRLAMGADHPLIWWRCTGKGRVFYSSLGHRAETYSDPTHLKLIDGAIAWAARREGKGCD